MQRQTVRKIEKWMEAETSRKHKSREESGHWDSLSGLTPNGQSVGFSWAYGWSTGDKVRPTQDGKSDQRPTPTESQRTAPRPSALNTPCYQGRRLRFLPLNAWTLRVGDKKNKSLMRISNHKPQTSVGFGARIPPPIQLPLLVNFWLWFFCLPREHGFQCLVKQT